MHIVHIEDFFHPSAGYKYNIISKYMVKFGHKVTIVAPDLKYRDDVLTQFFGNESIEELDKDFTRKYGVNIIRLNVKKYFRTRAIYNLNELNNTILGLRPDILSIGFEIIPAYYFLLKYKKNDFPIVLDCHNIKSATTFFLAPLHHLFHRIVYTPIINKNNIKVIRCVDDDYIEECLNIPVKNSPIVSFGSDLSLFMQNVDEKKRFRLLNGLSNNDIIFVYIGKLDNSKGGLMLADAFYSRFKTDYRICLLVVGNSSKENADELEKRLRNSQNTIYRYPTQKYVDMPYYFQVADAAVFPKQCSLSFFDAQACGLPVIAENIPINVNRLSHNNGFTFESNNINSFRNSIQKFIDLTTSDKKQMSENAFNFVNKYYNYEDRAKEYINVLIDEYNNYFSGRREVINKIV